MPNFLSVLCRVAVMGAQAPEDLPTEGFVWVLWLVVDGASGIGNWERLLQRSSSTVEGD